MSNPSFHDTDNAGAVANETDRDLISEAAKLIEQTQAAITRARGQIDETARLMSGLLKVSALFESLAARLVDATFKASAQVTHGPPSSVTLLALVEELGNLARQALGGAGDIRNELRTYANNTAPTVAAFREADHSLQDLSAALKHLAMLRTRPSPRSSSIEIENRVPSEVAQPQKAAVERSIAGAFTSRWARSGGFKN